ncbi:MAG: PAS domain-containing protein [Candidatus Eisenbacteria bacterium]|nr:PAS domain-containing protein [Candidatus Eisenbacteria bacterium]
MTPSGRGRVDQRSIEKLRRRLDEVLADADVAWWDWDIRTNVVTTNDRKVEMLGYEPDAFRGAGYEAFTDLLHPEDYERTMRAMRDHMEGRSPVYQVDYRIRKADGEYTWFMDRGLALERDTGGKPTHLRGLVIDLGSELNDAVHNEAVVKLARAVLPSSDAPDRLVVLCSVCGKLKLSDDDWYEVNASLPDAFPNEISHGICPVCVRELFPEEADEVLAGMGLSA